MNGKKVIQTVLKARCDLRHLRRKKIIMKKILFATLPAAFLAFAIHTGDPLPIGSPIPNPEIKMKDITGKDISFKDAQGKKGLLVMFSCNTCPVVKRYQSRSNEICKYALDKGI